MFRSVADYLIHSQIFIGLCASGMLLTTILFFELPLSVVPVLFLYSATQVAYVWMRYPHREAIPHSAFSVWMLHHQKIVVYLTAIHALIAGITFFWLTGQQQAVVMVALVISLLYSLPFGLRLNLFSLRKIGWLKTLPVAWCWVLAAVFLPEGIWNVSTSALLFFAAAQFGFIQALALLFDNKDVHTDSLSGTKTIAVKFGKDFNRHLIACFLLVTILLFYQLGTAALSLVSAIAIMVVYAERHFTHEYYYSLLADGLILLQTVVVYIWNKLFV